MGTHALEMDGGATRRELIYDLSGSHGGADPPVERRQRRGHRSPSGDATVPYPPSPTVVLTDGQLSMPRKSRANGFAPPRRERI
jgi:hypothetical protein